MEPTATADLTCKAWILKQEKVALEKAETLLDRKQGG